MTNALTRILASAAAALAVAALATGCGGSGGDDAEQDGSGGLFSDAFTSSGKTMAGKTTQDVIDLEAALAQGATVAEGGRPAMESYLGNAYARVYDLTVPVIEQQIAAFEITNNRYPRDAEELVSAILRPNGIELPLPRQGYAWTYDANEHTLVLVEFPEGAQPGAQPAPANGAPAQQPGAGMPGVPGQPPAGMPGQNQSPPAGMPGQSPPGGGN